MRLLLLTLIALAPQMVGGISFARAQTAVRPAAAYCHKLKIRRFNKIYSNIPRRSRGPAYEAIRKYCNCHAETISADATLNDAQRSGILNGRVKMAKSETLRAAIRRVVKRCGPDFQHAILKLERRFGKR